MSTFSPEERSVRTLEVAGWLVRVCSYRLGEAYFCTVDNVDPGARIARSVGPTREAAEALALERAEARLAGTRRRIG